MPYYKEGDELSYEKPEAYDPKEEAEVLPDLISLTTECEHEMVDGGIQKTGERVWFCSKCPHGYEEAVVLS